MNNNSNNILFIYEYCLKNIKDIYNIDYSDLLKYKANDIIKIININISSQQYQKYYINALIIYYEKKNKLIIDDIEKIQKTHEYFKNNKNKNNDIPTTILTNCYEKERKLNILYSNYILEFKEYLKSLQNQIDKNILNNKLIKNYILWEDIIIIKDKYKLSLDLNDMYSVSLLTLLEIIINSPPRQIEDYQNMFIIDDIMNIPDKIKNKNYYCPKTGEFIYNKYEYNLYGKISYKISEQLNIKIKEYINKFKVKNKLFNCILNIKNIIKFYCKKEVDINILQHSYITYRINNEISLYDKKKLAINMNYLPESIDEFYVLESRLKIKSCTNIKVSENTKKSYNNSIKNMKEKWNFNIDNIPDFNNFLVELKKQKNHRGENISDSSIKLHLSALIYYSRENNTNYDIFDDISKEIIRLCDKLNKKMELNKLSQRENEIMTSWLTIKKLHNEFEKIIKNNDNKKINQDYLLLSLYIYDNNPPRRIQDYCYMIYSDKELLHKNNITQINTNYINNLNDFNNIDNKPINKSEITTNFNYYIKIDNKSYFIFEKYKTYNKYGRQTIEVDNNLALIIDNYITKFKIKKNVSLFGFKENNFKMRLKNIFKSCLDKDITVNILRHSYITHQIINNIMKTEKERKILGYKMGHTVDMQRKYYKNISKERANKIEEIDIQKYLNKTMKGQKKYITSEDLREAKRKNNRRAYLKRKKKLLNN